MRHTIIAVLFCQLLLATWSNGKQGDSAPSNPCAANAQRQLDFWVGEWDLTWPGNKAGEVQRGTNSIRRVLDSCVVEENFSGGSDMHLRGMSFSIFDTTAGKWKQTWVDNEGGYLDFVGEFKDRQMILARQVTRPNGSQGLQRMVFKNIGADEFDWSWEGSRDGGKTWQVVWPIHYKRRKQPQNQ
jgi:hypothetical protein